MPIVRGVICDQCGVMMYWQGNVSKERAAAHARKAGSDILEYRWIGIAIACYNEQNAALPFPIKIAEARRERKYSELPTSKADPEQGMCAYHS